LEGSGGIRARDGLIAVAVVLTLGSLAVLFAAYGYLGRLAVSKGYRAGESGSSFTLAWPFYIRLVPALPLARRSHLRCRSRHGSHLIARELPLPGAAESGPPSHSGIIGE
jgi:hypothetical protein